MHTATLLTEERPNMSLINEIESNKGWFIEWYGGCVKLSADTKERLSELVEFFNSYTDK